MAVIREKIDMKGRYRKLYKNKIDSVHHGWNYESDDFTGFDLGINDKIDSVHHGWNYESDDFTGFDLGINDKIYLEKCRNSHLITVELNEKF